MFGDALQPPQQQQQQQQLFDVNQTAGQYFSGGGR
jgi:hypothetical protein